MKSLRSLPIAEGASTTKHRTLVTSATSSSDDHHHPHADTQSLDIAHEFSSTCLIQLSSDVLLSNSPSLPLSAVSLDEELLHLLDMMPGATLGDGIVCVLGSISARVLPRQVVALVAVGVAGDQDAHDNESDQNHSQHAWRHTGRSEVSQCYRDRVSVKWGYRDVRSHQCYQNIYTKGKVSSEELLLIYT